MTQKDGMKTILCYGDSNTWGYDPETGSRFPYEVRWTSVMASLLLDQARVIVEGLNGRTTVFEDPIEPGRNGLSYLMPALVSHMPLDAVVIMLGTNDTKHRFGNIAIDIASGMKRLVQTIREGSYGPDGKDPVVGIVAPACVNEWVEDGPFTGAHAISIGLASEYRNIADEMGCAFFDASQHVYCKMPDGIHLDAESHGILGKRLAQWVKQELIGS